MELKENKERNPGSEEMSIKVMVEVTRSLRIIVIQAENAM